MCRISSGMPDLADVVQQRGAADRLRPRSLPAPAPRRPARSGRRRTPSAPRCSCRAPRAPARGRRRPRRSRPRRPSSAPGAPPEPSLSVDAGRHPRRGRPRARSEHGRGACRRSARAAARRCPTDTETPTLVGRLEGLEVDQDPPQDGAGLLARGLGKQHDELVAARAAGEVVGPGARRQELPHRGQHHVADSVAARHVQVAETVDVEHRHRQRAAVAMRALHVQLQLGAEGRQGQQAGDQRVARGKPRASSVSSSEIRVRAAASCAMLSTPRESTSYLVSAGMRSALNARTARPRARSIRVRPRTGRCHPERRRRRSRPARSRPARSCC